MGTLEKDPGEVVVTRHQLSLATFAEIILRLRSDADKDERQEAFDNELRKIDELGISVAVTHGSSKTPIGASRQYFLKHDGAKTMIRARSIHTEQLTRWPRRRRVRKWIEDRLDPRHTGTEKNSDTDQSYGNGED